MSLEAFSMTLSLNRPSYKDHDAAYPTFLCNTGNKKAIFDLLTDDRSIVNSVMTSKLTGLSPMVAAEPILSQAIKEGKISELSSHEKHFVGTVLSSLLTANGAKKTNRKQKFSKGIFRSAEIYAFPQT